MPRAWSASFLAVLAVATGIGGGCGDGDDQATPPSTLAPPPIVDPTASTAPTATTATTAPPTTRADPTTTSPARPHLDAVTVRLTEVVTGLESPTAFAVRRDDDAWYVTEQVGRLRVIRDGVLDPVPVLDLTDEVGSAGNEQGLLGVAFSPAGDELYVDYTDRAGDTRVVAWSFADGGPDPASRRDVLFVDQPYGNHNGGDLRFGHDGMLYVALGDGGSGGDPHGNAQDLGTLLGSILRIAPRPVGDAPYGIPSDNPFVDVEGARAEIWHYGLRNPWRFSFDRATREMWIGDVGQDAWEEIDWAAAGESGVNYGWNAREGAHDYAGGAPPGVRDPVFAYGHDVGDAVTGGFVYRGEAIPALRGAYVFADYGAGVLQALDAVGGQLVAARSLGVDGGEVTSFGEDADGELVVLDRAGRVLRLEPA